MGKKISADLFEEGVPVYSTQSITPEFEISQKYQIIQMPKEPAYPIAESDWKHIRDMVEKIKYKSSIFSNVGSLLMGAAITSFFNILFFSIELSKENLDKYILMWAIFGASLMGGALCLIFAHLQTKQTSTSKDEVITFIDHLNNKFIKS
jgi:hypothetical protein